MDAGNENGAARMQDLTNVERTSDCELVVKRAFAAPVHIVFQAWTKPELFMRWWAPKSSGVPLLSCDMDVRTGGKYRLEFGKDAAHSFVFFGKYIEVIPNSRIVWTNDEGEEGSITTVTFKEDGGKTQLVLHDLYPSKSALDEAMASGSTSCFGEQFEQLDAFLVADAGGHA